MRTWDESIYAVNTYEMMQNGNYLVPHFKGQIDIINDKPPLFFWNQIISFKLFGYNEFAARFPSALYGALSVIFLFSFLQKRFNIIIGLTAALVLCCSQGFVTFHSSRTGDMDSMLAFGILGMFISLYNYSTTENIKHYLLFGIFLIFAFLTKTLAAFIILPAFFVSLFGRNFRALFNLKVWLINILALTVIVLFLFFRNRYSDHYFTTHFLGYFSRYKTQYNADHDKPFDFYINNLYYFRYSIFSIFLIPGLLFAFYEKDALLKKLLVSSLGSALFMLLFLSFSSSKCYWYDVPLYPLFAISVSYCLVSIARLVENKNRTISLLLSLFMLAPLFFAIKRSHNNDIADVNARKCEVIPEYFYDHKANTPYPRLVVSDVNFNSPIFFYTYMFREFKKEIVIADADKLTVNDVVIAGNDSIKKYIDEHYKTTKLETYKNAIIYKIEG